MRILNLHIHTLGIDVYNENKFRGKDSQYKINPYVQFEANSDKYLLSFKCNHCNEFYDDYKSYPDKEYIPQYFKESIFSCKNMIKNFKLKNNFKIFEFVELSNLYLIGTKNEIISYICREYYKLNEQYNNSQKLINNLDSNIKEEKQKFSNLNSKITGLESKLEKLTKENDLTKFQLKNEKKLKKDLESKNSELQEQANQKIIQNKELEKNLNEKEIKLINLTKSKKDLEINVENLKKNLNIKENEIKEINAFNPIINY